ncbi:hypothetical protein ACIQSP_16690 [Streptomyces nigra]|uniref:hypothetical protein n=1 Tax=Streptomyces nigra TaxID=1827580 RepID=UPI00380F1FF2
MSAAEEILRVLKNEYRRLPDPHTAALDQLAAFEDFVLAKAFGRLRDFTPVWTTSDGHDIPSTELRCVLCDGLVQAVGVKTLLDHNALATSHNCTTRKDGA